MTVSYGTITSDDTDYMLILDDLNFSGSIFTINPSFSYFVKDNLSFGARFGYSKTDGHIDNAALDLGEANDMNISFSDINLNSTSSSFGIFMRSYAGIDAKGHFGCSPNWKRRTKPENRFSPTNRTKRSNIPTATTGSLNFRSTPAVRSSSSRTYAPPSPSGSAACNTRK